MLVRMLGINIKQIGDKAKRGAMKIVRSQSFGEPDTQTLIESKLGRGNQHAALARVVFS
jgi:hypothetical protein